jgi:hypothetical protein
MPGLCMPYIVYVYVYVYVRHKFYGHARPRSMHGHGACTATVHSQPVGQSFRECIG